MEHYFFEIEGRDAYRFMVRHAAFKELEGHGLDSTALNALQESSEAKQREAQFDSDRALAENYCRLIGSTFEDKFQQDVTHEVKRLKQAASRTRPSTSRSATMIFLRSLSPAKWILGSVIFAASTILLIWSTVLLMKLSGSAELGWIYAASTAVILAVELPALFLLEKRRQMKLRQAA